MHNRIATITLGLLLTQACALGSDAARRQEVNQYHAKLEQDGVLTPTPHSEEKAWEEWKKENPHAATDDLLTLAQVAMQTTRKETYEYTRSMKLSIVYFAKDRALRDQFPAENWSNLAEILNAPLPNPVPRHARAQHQPQHQNGARRQAQRRPF